MTYDQLRALDAIVQCGSFRAASEKLHLSQPAVSIAVKKLEDEFDLTLFSRDQYRPSLTPEGRVFYLDARRVLFQTEALEKLGKRLSVGNEPEIRIALSLICPFDELLSEFKSFGAENPHTQISLSVEYLGGATERLLDGTVDFALTSLSQRLGHHDIQPYRTVSLIPVAAPQHPLAHTQRFLQDKEIQGYVEVRILGSEIITRGTETDPALENRHWVVSDYLVAQRFIESGLCWGFLPDHQANPEVNAGRLVPVRVAKISPLTVELKLVRRLDHPLGTISNNLWNRLLGSVTKTR